MNTFLRSICRPSSWLVVGVLGLLQGPPPHPQPLSPAGERGELVPFLEEFKERKETPIIEKSVQFSSVVGKVEGLWARQDKKESLPAVLVVYEEAAWTDWMKLNVRHFASIGYEVLAVQVGHPRQEVGVKDSFRDEVALAKLSAAVRWLRGRADVLPNRLGVVGWGGGQALALAAALPVQACVVCDAPLPMEPSIIQGLRETPVLGVFGGKDKITNDSIAAFRKARANDKTPTKFHVAEGAYAEFMGPPTGKRYVHDAAEDAWVVIYNFLETHVEDLRPPVASFKPIASIADIMRSVNEPAGVRGVLSKALEEEPTSARQWGRVRANAALMAEAGAWLQMHPPSKGPASHWKEQARAYTNAAEALVNAADKRDYAGARTGLTNLAKQCAACHEAHR